MDESLCAITTNVTPCKEICEQIVGRLLKNLVDSISVSFPLMHQESIRFVLSRLMVQLGNRNANESYANFCDTQRLTYLTALTDHLYVLAETDPYVWLLIWDLPLLLVADRLINEKEDPRFAVLIEKCRFTVDEISGIAEFDESTVKRATVAAWQIWEIMFFLARSSTAEIVKSTLSDDLDFLQKSGLLSLQLQSES